MTEPFQTTDNGGLRVLAPAKLNLYLLIAGKRADGFHAIETLMTTINWYDTLVFEPGGGNGLELVCTGPHWAPDGPDNLVWRACRRLLEKAGQTLPLKVTLTKNIPAGTGLGSASSDAAAALLGLNRFAGLNEPIEALHDIAAQLGSDIPFFLYGPAAICTGRGEKIHPLTQKITFDALVFTPNISVPTKSVYEKYTHVAAEYEHLSAEIKAQFEKKGIDSDGQICANMLESSCFALYQELAEIKERCQTYSGRKVCLSGSGSAMFILNPEKKQLEKLQFWLKREFNCESRFVNNNRW